MRNKDIEKWEKRRAAKKIPKKAKKIPKKAKKLTPTWAYYATLGLMVLWNFVGEGAAIGYLIIGWGFPWIVRIFMSTWEVTNFDVQIHGQVAKNLPEEKKQLKKKKNNLIFTKMEVIQVKVTKLTELNIIENIQDGLDYFKFVCSSKMKINDEEIEFEFTEEEGSGGILRLKNDNEFFEEVETENNLNLSVILFIFHTDSKSYQEMNIGDTWELEFDKKTWDEGGENRDWGYLSEPY